MTKKILAFLGLVILVLWAMKDINTNDLTTSYDMPEASQIVKDDLIDKATKFTMPIGCKLDDLERIARGKYLYHN